MIRSTSPSTSNGSVTSQNLKSKPGHPRSPGTAYVAALGHLWGPNPERGVFRTTDGGATWEHVLALDLALNPPGGAQHA